jgi:hypothetical protein
MSGKQSVPGFDQIIINLVVPAFDVNRDDLAEILLGLDEGSQSLLVDLLSAPSDFVTGGTWVSLPAASSISRCRHCSTPDIDASTRAKPGG